MISPTDGGVCVKIRREERRSGITFERPLASRHLIQDDAEREDVGAVIRDLAFHLFRRHVGDGTEHDSFGGDGLRWKPGQCLRRIRIVGQLRQAEVEDLRTSVRCDHDVGGLQITMGDPSLVSGADAVNQRDRELEQLIKRQAVTRDDGGEGSAIDEFHRQTCHVVESIDRVHRDDVRMVQRGCGERFLLESTNAIRMAHEPVRERLQCDIASEFGISRAIHLSHATAAQEGHDFVRTESRAWNERHADPGGLYKALWLSEGRIAFASKLVGRGSC